MPWQWKQTRFSFTHSFHCESYESAMEQRVSVQQVWSWPSLAPYVTWLGLTCSAHGVVGTSQGSARGLALMGGHAQRWAATTCPIWHWSQIGLRWGSSGRLMLALLWTLSLGMIKGDMLGDWVKLDFTWAAPFILRYYVIKAYAN